MSSADRSTTTSTTASTTSRADRSRSPLYSALIGLASLGVLLQGVWAGLFLRRGASGRETWVDVHNIGGEVTFALALIATVVALATLRHRRPVVIGSIVFTVLLAIEVYLGMALDDHSGLTALHVPLAMLLMGLAVWLPLRARP